MRAIIVLAVLLATIAFVPMATAEPEPPECYDCGPIVDGGVAQVWLTHGCDPYVVFHEPSCWIGDLNICP